MRLVSDLPSEVDNGKLRAIFKADLLTTTWEVAEELNINHSMVTQHLKHIGKVKKLGKWVPPEQLQIKKNHRFEVSSSLILATIMNNFLTGL